MLKSIGSNWAVTLVTVIALYLLTPFTLDKLGADGYGTWVLITSQHVANGDTRGLNAAISSCTGMYLMLGLIALLIGLGLYAFFTLYGIPTPLHTDARSAFVVMAVFVAVGFVALLPEGILAAHGDFVPRNVVRLASLVLRLGLTIALLLLHASLTVLALVQLACLAFDFILCWLIIRRRYPETHIRLAGFD